MASGSTIQAKRFARRPLFNRENDFLSLAAAPFFMFLCPLLQVHNSYGWPSELRICSVHSARNRHVKQQFWYTLPIWRVHKPRDRREEIFHHSIMTYSFFVFGPNHNKERISNSEVVGRNHRPAVDATSVWVLGLCTKDVRP